MAVSKATLIEKERRIHEVQALIIEGMQDYSIMRKCKEEWNVSARTAKRYIAEAYKRWKKDRTVDLDNRRDSRIAELQQDIRGMEEKFKNTPQGLNTILRFKKELSKLEDLYPARRLIHSGDADNPVKIQASPFMSEQDEKDYQKYLTEKYNSV